MSTLVTIYLIGMIVTSLFIVVLCKVMMKNDPKVIVTTKDIFGSVVGVILWPLFWLLVIISRVW